MMGVGMMGKSFDFEDDYPNFGVDDIYDGGDQDNEDGINWGKIPPVAKIFG